MPQSSSPFLLGPEVEFTLALVGPTGPSAEVDFSCQLNRAELVPTAGGGAGEQTYETFCGPHTSGAGASGSTWSVELSNFQAYADITDLSNFLFDHETEAALYSLRPVGAAATATTPAFEGECTLVAQNIGGTAATYAVATVSLPCKAKPTKVIA